MRRTSQTMLVVALALAVGVALALSGYTFGRTVLLIAGLVVIGVGVIAGIVVVIFKGDANVPASAPPRG
jgi:hypothetical protein